MDDKGQNNVDQLTLKSVFLNKPLNIYIFKKTKKIQAASYLLTDHIKDIDPLKWTIRKTAADLGGLAMSFETNFKERLSAGFTLLRSHFEIAFIAKLISQSNAEIITREIDKLLYEIDASDNDATGRQLDGQFFAVDKNALPRSEEKSFLAPELTFAVLPEAEGNVFYKRHSPQPVGNNFQKTPAKHPDRSLDKGHRSEIILKIIKEKREVTIKDITSTIKDVSEKTVQRELNSLLSQGRIKKTGERRWSRYSLK